MCSEILIKGKKIKKWWEKGKKVKKTQTKWNLTLTLKSSKFSFVRIVLK